MSQSADETEIRLEVSSIGKRYLGVVALEDVSLRLMAGETLAVIGENGAGKSTLMKILAGIVSPDGGEIRLRGEPVSFASPAEALHAGVALIHQELNLHEELSVAENLFLGREPHRFGWLDRRTMYRSAKDALAQVGLSVSPRTPLAALSTAGRQLVEIAKALVIDASVVIMDEPTSSLSSREAERLFGLVERMRDRGVSVIYISHRLGEVKRLADRVIVLRDGRHAGELSGVEIEHDRMVSAMVGRQISQLFHREPQPPGATELEVTGLRVGSKEAAPVDLSVRRGEIVGVAGLMGSGRTELLETIFGVRRAAGGEVRVAGQLIRSGVARGAGVMRRFGLAHRSGAVRRAIGAGVALVPEDRKLTGLLLESSVRENATLAALSDAPAAPWVDRRWQQRATLEVIDRLGVKTASPTALIGHLSGGNQQKIAFGKWWLRRPRVLLLDEPTRGVDVGAKQEIYGLLDQLAAEGMAILFVSSEMEEVLALADRVLVMNAGRIAGELPKSAISEEAIMRLAVGAESCN